MNGPVLGYANWSLLRLSRWHRTFSNDRARPICGVQLDGSPEFWQPMHPVVIGWAKTAEVCEDCQKRATLPALEGARLP